MLLIVAIIFIVLGILIKHFKMYFLIAGYNTMSREEQAKYDIEGIATIFRNTMFGMALILLIGYGFSMFFENSKIELYTLVLAIAIGIPYLLITSNSDKYKVD